VKKTLPPDEAKPRRRTLSLAEMAANDSASVGIRCPRCQCLQFEVRNTIPVPEGTRRYRVCRNCGTTITTIERRGIA
jgi:hypothetical protein